MQSASKMIEIIMEEKKSANENNASSIANDPAKLKIIYLEEFISELAKLEENQAYKDEFEYDRNSTKNKTQQLIREVVVDWANIKTSKNENQIIISIEIIEFKLKQINRAFRNLSSLKINNAELSNQIKKLSAITEQNIKYELEKLNTKKTANGDKTEDEQLVESPKKVEDCKVEESKACEEQQLQKYSERLQAAFPTEEIKLIGQNTVRTPQHVFNFIENWKGEEKKDLTLNSQELNVVCPFEKMEDLIKIIEYYPRVQAPLKKLNECYSNDLNSDSDLHNSIKKIITEINSSTQCNLKDKLKELEKINRKYKGGRLKSLFKPDNTLDKTLKEIKEMMNPGAEA